MGRSHSASSVISTVLAPEESIVEPRGDSQHLALCVFLRIGNDKDAGLDRGHLRSLLRADDVPSSCHLPTPDCLMQSGHPIAVFHSQVYAVRREPSAHLGAMQGAKSSPMAVAPSKNISGLCSFTRSAMTAA